MRRHPPLTWERNDIYTVFCDPRTRGRIGKYAAKRLLGSVVTEQDNRKPTEREVLRPVVAELSGDNGIAAARECMFTEITKRASHERHTTDRRSGVTPNMGARVEGALGGGREFAQRGLLDIANGTKARNIGLGDMLQRGKRGKAHKGGKGRARLFGTIEIGVEGYNAHATTRRLVHRGRRAVTRGRGGREAIGGGDVHRVMREQDIGSKLYGAHNRVGRGIERAGDSRDLSVGISNGKTHVIPRFGVFTWEPVE